MVKGRFFRSPVSQPCCVLHKYLQLSELPENISLLLGKTAMTNHELVIMV